MGPDISHSVPDSPVTDVAVAHGYFPDQSRIWFVVARQSDGQIWRAAHEQLGMAGALLTGMLRRAPNRLNSDAADAPLSDLSRDRGHSPETNRENSMMLRELATKIRAQAKVLCHIAKVRRNLSQGESPAVGR